MKPEQNPEPLPLFLDKERGLFDPTGLIHEAPDDPYMEDWLKTAYLVHKALEDNPDNPFIEESQSVIFEAITRRDLELKRLRRREGRRPPLT